MPEGEYDKAGDLPVREGGSSAHGGIAARQALGGSGSGHPPRHRRTLSLDAAHASGGGNTPRGVTVSDSQEAHNPRRRPFSAERSGSLQAVGRRLSSALGLRHEEASRHPYAVFLPSWASPLVGMPMLHMQIWP